MRHPSRPARRPRHALGLLLLAGCAAGCRAVREARVAQDAAQAGPGERQASAAELGLPVRGPVALEALVELALRAHPAVAAARFAAAAAQARVREAESARLPQLSTDASLTYRDQQAGGAPTAHHFDSLGFSLSWLLFDFGRNAALERNAAEAALAAQLDLCGSEVDTCYGVRSAYFELAKELELAAVAHETVQQFEQRLEQVRGFVEAGTRIPYDQTTAEVALENARLSEVQARDAALLAQATLAHAVGLAEIVDWTPDAASALPELPADFEAAWALARERQPALAAAAARERAASALVDARIAALYPALDLLGSVSESGTGLPLSWSWSLGGALSWVPFDGFQRLSTLDESAASLRAARAARTQSEQAAWLELRTAWLALEDAHGRLELTTLAVRSAEQNLVLAQGRFEVGKSTSVELTDAQQSLAQARGDDVQARADEHTARARVARSLGIAADAH